jgi:beta-lactamase regulating signal transducer with metallopeptidase domain
MIYGLPEMIAARVLNSIPVGFAIAALTWVGLKAFQKQGSGVRFAIWFLTLLGIAAVPFVPSFQNSGSSALPLHTGLTLPATWAAVIVGVWVGVLMLIAVRFAFGMWNLWKLKGDALPIETSELPSEAQYALTEFRPDRQVQVCRSKRVRVPTAIGFWKPTVLLPDWAMTELSDQDLTAVLLHELAHLRRRDDWTNLAGKVLGAIFFFHPAVWFVQRRLELEREIACDELVLAKTGNRQAYAECLVSLAERSFARRSVAMAQAIIGHAKSTAIRLTRILSPGQSRPYSYAGAMTFASGLLALCVFLSPGVPKFVAFENAVSVEHGVARQVARATSEATAPGAKIETSYHPDRAKIPAVKARATSAKSIVARKPQKPASAVLARETLPEPTHSSRTQYVLVMQTQVDGNGELRTNFCVWKLILRESDNRAIRAQIISSSL